MLASRTPIRKDSKRSRFKAYPIGYFHIDIAQVSTEQGKLHLFVAIDRTSEFAFVQLHEKATQRSAAAFLHDLEPFPFRLARRHRIRQRRGSFGTHPVGRRRTRSRWRWLGWRRSVLQPFGGEL